MSIGVLAAFDAVSSALTPAARKGLYLRRWSGSLIVKSSLCELEGGCPTEAWSESMMMKWVSQKVKERKKIPGRMKVGRWKVSSN